MTRAALIDLLDASSLTEAQRARILADFDAGRITTPEQAAAAIAALEPKRGGGGWIYDPGSRRYIAPTLRPGRPDPRLPEPPTTRAGRPLSPEDVRKVLDYALDHGEAEMVRVTEDLRDGRINLAEWRRRMERMIAVRVMAASTLGMGGFDQVSGADRGRIGAEIAEQFRFLRGFARDILTGKQPLNGRAIARARQYAQAPRGIYESIRGRVAQFAGNNEERRVLGGADHCTASGTLPGCLGLAQLGWQPIGTLPRIGGAVCRSNCRCRFQFRRTA